MELGGKAMMSDDVKLYTGECATIMAAHIPDASIDLTVTSPPYDNLRTYNGYTFDFEAIAAQLWRVTKPGGVVVWVVGDGSRNHCESLTSFKQAIRFNEIGFNLLDTMIYRKLGNFHRFNHKVYPQAFEFMFVLSKGNPVTFNPIRDKPNSQAGSVVSGTKRNVNGTLRSEFNLGLVLGDVGMRNNVWTYGAGFGLSTTDKDAFLHPAIFPEALARDHILSWSNPGDLVLDPMCGSGTTLKMALQYGRRCIGIDISAEYVELTRERIAKVLAQPPLFRLTPLQADAARQSTAEQLALDAAQLKHGR